MDNNIIITGRHLGRTRAWMEQAEKFLLENPGATVSWPSSPFPRATKPIYDGMRINRMVHDGDDPWYVPVDWIIANPEKYAELMEQRRKTMEAWNKAFKIKSPDIVGKAIITSLVDTGEAMWQNLWDDSDPKDNGLKRFFIPAYRKEVDEFGNEKD